MGLWPVKAMAKSEDGGYNTEVISSNFNVEFDIDNDLIYQVKMGEVKLQL